MRWSSTILIVFTVTLPAYAQTDRAAQDREISVAAQDDQTLLAACHLFRSRSDLRTPALYKLVEGALKEHQLKWGVLGAKGSILDNNVRLLQAATQTECQAALDDELNFSNLILPKSPPPDSSTGAAIASGPLREELLRRYAERRYDELERGKRRLEIELARGREEKESRLGSARVTAKDSLHSSTVSVASISASRALLPAPQAQPPAPQAQLPAPLPPALQAQLPVPQAQLTVPQAQLQGGPVPQKDPLAAPEIEPWPPPIPTDQATYTVDLGKFRTVGSFADALMSRLNEAGVFHLRFWGAPNGVAVVVPLEGIDDLGRPIRKGTNAATARADVGGPLSAIIAGFLRLLSEPIRDSRILLFILTNDSKVKNPAVTMTTKIARRWTQNEYVWPTVNRAVPLTDDHFVIVSVYEFRKHDKGDPELLTEGKKLHSVTEHLAASGIQVIGLLK
jgi:hypothetical protein